MCVCVCVCVRACVCLCMCKIYKILYKTSASDLRRRGMLFICACSPGGRGTPSAFLCSGERLLSCSCDNLFFNFFIFSVDTN